MYKAKMSLQKNTREDHPLAKVFSSEMNIIFLSYPNLDETFMFFGAGSKGWVTSIVTGIDKLNGLVIIRTMNSEYAIRDIEEVENGESININEFLGDELSNNP